ncbi:peptidase [uncultured Mediterranean phage uvMED]|nr:peptidase [uncultured Mediterranean phage uvMED]BAQ91693.1 peptidase [uncultured Mediterranean phage uvMED]BAQ91733.1 peptidase [uncultured Mediterranean phage uvMED]BAQ91780.1 peptidase [uncultured Mediterranean phage uvMED]BAR20494.1 peptidase [uncultured Mediterranean phage uvMED]
MVVAEILTGIALVQKSVEFIKSNISTVNDIKDIAKQIDGFFDGEEQMNKKQGKGMSIAEQFGSVESSASDFIDRKLLEEQRYELKLLIDNRFGHGTWEQILAERSEKIRQVKEAQKKAKLEAKKQREEIYEVLKWIAYTLLGLGVVILLVTIGVKAFAYEYKSKNLTRNQKINNGTIVPPKMTTCRLKKQKVYKDKLACIYEGANRKFTLDFADIRVGCPKQFKCKYDSLNSKEPSIDSVMESLRSIAK